MHYLSEYQTFKNKQQLNEAVTQHLALNRYDLNATDRATLKAVARYAVKFAGAAHLKAGTIANLIGKSVKTARRAVNKLAELGIVSKVATTRKVNGGKGANIIVILPVDERELTIEEDTTESVQSTVSSRQQAEMPTASKTQTSENTTEPIYSFNRNIYIKETAPTHGALKRSIPSELFATLKPYFNDADMYNVVGILYRAKSSVDRSIMFEDFTTDYIDAFQSVIFRYKRGKVRNLFGCLFVAWRQVATEIKRRLTVNDSGIFYDWLT